jgi:2-methylaconitate cis-trans-isomerase PrpF
MQFPRERDWATVRRVMMKIPCVLMRAGSSRGPFFLKEWLPASESERNRALVAAIGSGDVGQISGLGGGSSLTSKVAIVSKSSRPGVDVDYLFAQVGVTSSSVDVRPNCGNMLSGVGPFSIEQGLVPAQADTTVVRVFNVNTQSRVDVAVQTPGGVLTYDGSEHIDGVKGCAAPIRLEFLDAWGATTGSVFPTGHRTDLIDGVKVTCIDAAMPLMIVAAQDLGVQASDTPAALDGNSDLLARLEHLRMEAGRRMGLGDVSQSVIPKPVLVHGGPELTSVTSRYFTPWRCHASHAVTGAIGVATARALQGTVLSHTGVQPGTHCIQIHHPQGRIAAEVRVESVQGEIAVTRASLIRTARKIFEGTLHLNTETEEYA